MNLYVCGDLHGSSATITNFYYNTIKDTVQEYEENWIILLGDAGFLYYIDQKDDKFKADVSRYPFKYFVIRGNHEARAGDIAAYDNYTGWEEVEVFGNTCLRQVCYPNIYYAKDEGGIYNIAGRKTLVIPGAYSIDKYYRLMRGWNWFSGEQLTEREMEALFEVAKNQHFDLVLSHTCGYTYMPTDLFLRGIDQSSVDNTMERWMDHLFDHITFGVHLWGHFHADRVQAPNREILFTEVENIEDIEERWRRYDEIGELDWWIPRSPEMEK